MTVHHDGLMRINFRKANGDVRIYCINKDGSRKEPIYVPALTIDRKSCTRQNGMNFYIETVGKLVELPNKEWQIC